MFRSRSVFTSSTFSTGGMGALETWSSIGVAWSAGHGTHMGHMGDFRCEGQTPAICGGSNVMSVIYSVTCCMFDIYIYIFTAADSAEYMEVATMDAVLKYQDDEGMSQNMSKAITIVCHYFVE